MRPTLSLRTAIAACALAAAAALVGCARPEVAAKYPSRPVNLYIGSTPAGSTDILGRVLARSLEQTLGQRIVVHNRTGAGGSVMAAQLMSSAPDGYSIGMTISHAYTANPTVTPAAVKYGVEDFTHLASVSKGQCAIVTGAGKPYETLADVIAAAKRGEEPVFASQSAVTRLLASYIARVEGVRFRIITVQGGGELLQAILGGHADFGFSGGPHVDHLATGQIRVLASAEDARLATSPEVPTLKEQGYDLSSCSLFLVSAPPKLPQDIKATLSAALAEAVRSDEKQALLASLQYPEHYLGPEEVTQALEDEAAMIARAVTRLQ